MFCPADSILRMPMCGICGFFHKRQQPADRLILAAMCGTLRHRGPAGAGRAITGSLALGQAGPGSEAYPAGAPLLHNEDERLALVWDGAIFNYRDLRENLAVRGHRLRTAGDGEIIVHLYEEYGAALPLHLRGQFALALWDSAAQTLFLARDHTGEKPLYYYDSPEIFVFASEIKALLQHPAVPRAAALDDPATLALYLGYGYLPGPATAFRHIDMLPPGHSLTLHADQAARPQRYWQMPPLAPVMDGVVTPLDYEDRLKELLAEAVRLRLTAAALPGAFLSGGLASSLIVAMMQQQNRTVKTFSLRLDSNPTDPAAPVAQHLGTDHTTFRVEPAPLALLPRLVWHYDAPFADVRAIPAYLLSELAAEHVTTVLTGAGGRALFTGDARFAAAVLRRRWPAVPRPLWPVASALAEHLPPRPAEQHLVQRAAAFLDAAGPPARAYFETLRLFDAAQIQRLTGQADAAGAHFAATLAHSATLPHLLHASLLTTLPDELLITLDRCSQAAGLAARAPYMDAPLIDYVATIPLNLKWRGHRTGDILQEAARGLLPDRLITRPPSGPGVPLGAWLRRDAAAVREVLLSPAARRRGLVQPAAVTALLDEHTAGRHDHAGRLWALLTLEGWYRLFIDAAQPAAAPPGGLP